MRVAFNMKKPLVIQTVQAMLPTQKQTTITQRAICPAAILNSPLNLTAVISGV